MEITPTSQDHSHQLELNQTFTNQLVNERESGMGFQTVLCHVGKEEPIVGVVLNATLLMTHEKVDNADITKIEVYGR